MPALESATFAETAISQHYAFFNQSNRTKVSYFVRFDWLKNILTLHYISWAQILGCFPPSAAAKKFTYVK